MVSAGSVLKRTILTPCGACAVSLQATVISRNGQGSPYEETKLILDTDALVYCCQHSGPWSSSSLVSAVLAVLAAPSNAANGVLGKHGMLSAPECCQRCLISLSSVLPFNVQPRGAVYTTSDVFRRFPPLAVVIGGKRRKTTDGRRTSPNSVDGR
jgi:hypothetical protein